MEKMSNFSVNGEDELNSQPNVTDPDYFKFIIDCSSSMEKHSHSVREGLKNYKKRLSRIDEATSIYVSRADFNQYYEETNYLPINNFSTDYYVDGCTDLYSAIVNSTRNTIEVFEQLISDGYDPRMTNIIFTDGEHYLNGRCSVYSFEDAKEIVEKATNMGITMVFIDFGGENGNIPKELGYQSVYAPENSTEALIETINDITNSCIRQSQSKISNSSDWLYK